MKRRIAVVALWMFGLFAVAAYYIPLFTLHEIQVEGNAAHLESDIVALLEAEEGSNLMRLDLEGWVNVQKTADFLQHGLGMATQLLELNHFQA